MHLKLYLIRHGETEANRDGILQGHCDYPLTDKGIQQAVLRGETLKGVKWDYVYTSDLTRAHKTTEIILAASDHGPILINPNSLLREHSFGVREALPRGTSVEDAKNIVAKRLSIPVEEVIDSAESAGVVKLRQAEFLTRLRPCGSPLDSEPTKVLCVSHGAFIKSFLKTFCSDLGEVAKIGNCSLSIIHITWNDSSPSSADGKEGKVHKQAETGLDMEKAVKHARNGKYMFHCHALPEETNVCLSES